MSENNLDKIFVGKNEAEIDKIKAELASMIDKAAETAKGDLDIEKEFPEVFSEKVPPEKVNSMPVEVISGSAIKKADPFNDSKVGADKSIELIQGVGDITIDVVDIPGRTTTTDITEKDGDVNVDVVGWDEKFNKVISETYTTHNLWKVINRSNRKRKWNAFFNKIKLPFSFKTDKEDGVIGQAYLDVFLGVKSLDDRSLGLINGIRDETGIEGIMAKLPCINWDEVISNSSGS